MEHADSLGLILAIGLSTLIAIYLAFFIATIFFCLSCHKLLTHIDEKFYLFPRWFVWLQLIPIVGSVFSWLMLPFGIPEALKKHFANNPVALKEANKIFGIGLAYCICIVVAFFPLLFLNILIALGAIALWIIYWVKIVHFRKNYLLTN